MMNSTSGTNPFLHRLMKDKKEDVVHSSAYGDVQNRQGIGVASTESFSARQAIDANRSMVKKYGESKVVNEVGDGTPKAKQFDAAVEAAKAAAIKEQFSNQKADKTAKYSTSSKTTTTSGVSASSASRPSPAATSIQNSIKNNIRPNFKNSGV